MTQVLVTKPDSLTPEDRQALREAGIVVVETFDPASVKMLQTEGPELATSDMLLAAMRAISRDNWSDNVAHKFPAILCELMEEERTRRMAPPRDATGRFVRRA